MTGALLHALLPLAMAIAASACGDDPAATAVTAETLVGTYDVTLRAADGRTATALGRVTRDGDRISIQNDLDGWDADQSFYGTVAEAGVPFVLNGGERREDVATGTKGTFTVIADDTRLIIRGMAEDGGFIFFRPYAEPAAGPIEVVLVRPRDGVPRFLRGSRTLDFLLLPSPSGTREPSSVRLRVDVQRDGSCVSAAAVEDDDEARTRFEAGSCVLSPEGRFRLSTVIEPDPPNERLDGTSSYMGFQGRLRVAGGGRVAGEGWYELLYAISPEPAGLWELAP